MAIGNGLRFLKNSKARKAEEAIVRSEGILAVLALSPADMRAAEQALGIARDLLAREHFTGARDAALRAEAIAVALDERYRGYEKAVRSLRERMERMKDLGLPRDAPEAALTQAEARVAAGIWEEGSLLPDYQGARKVLEEAEADAQALVERAEAASNAVFMGAVAIEELASIRGPPDPSLFSRGAVSSLEVGLEGAMRQLAERKFEQAVRIAGDIEARANRLRAAFIAANDGLTAAAAILAELRGQGGYTGRLTSQLSIVRDVLFRGVIEPASEMARALLADAQALQRAYRDAREGLAEAEARYTRLVREGHLSSEVDLAVRDARRAMRDGEYVRALRHVEDATGHIERIASEREGLARSLQENWARATAPEEADAFLPDVEELLVRAEKEFQEGRYSESQEDLVVAKALLSPNHKGKPRRRGPDAGSGKS